MKKVLIPFFILVMFVNGVLCTAQTISGQAGGYNYVDLGLPSGTKWATCNIGANDPFEYGDYFAWGEVEAKKKYNWDTYKWSGAKLDSLYKYCTQTLWGNADSTAVLLADDDAATVAWGNAWRMPTKTEQDELLEGCNWVWTVNYNGSRVAGSIGTSKTNGNTIFLPAGGYRLMKSNFDEGESGFYWSASLFEEYSFDAYAMELKNARNKSIFDKRRNGNNIRAVVR